jgi:hypothetical protein
MGWIFFVVLTVGMAFAGIRSAQRAGRWSWPKFALTLGFLAVQSAIVTLPVMLMNMNSRYFWGVYAAGWIVALGNFVWFILWARHWKLPNSKTALEADREQSQK